MDAAQLRTYLLGKPGAVADFPFGPQPLVLKVGGKMFALLSEREAPLQLSLKCDPYHAQMLRAEYAAVRAGYHLDKRHWITVALDGSVPPGEVWGLIDQSYALVVQKLSRAARRELEVNNAEQPSKPRARDEG